MTPRATIEAVIVGLERELPEPESMHRVWAGALRSVLQALPKAADFRLFDWSRHTEACNEPIDPKHYCSDCGQDWPCLTYQLLRSPGGDKP